MKSESRPKCSIAKGPFCINKKSINDMGDDFRKAYMQYMEMMNPELTKNPVDCVKKAFFQDYWTAKGKQQNPSDDKFGLYLFLAVSTGAIVIIAVLLLVIYLKRKTGENDEQTEEVEQL